MRRIAEFVMNAEAEQLRIGRSPVPGSYPMVTVVVDVLDPGEQDLEMQLAHLRGRLDQFDHDRRP